MKNNKSTKAFLVVLVLVVLAKLLKCALASAENDEYYDSAIGVKFRRTGNVFGHANNFKNDIQNFESAFDEGFSDAFG